MSPPAPSRSSSQQVSQQLSGRGRNRGRRAAGSAWLGGGAGSLQRRHPVEQLGRGVRYVRSTIVPGDEALMSLFEAASEALVREAYARAGLPIASRRRSKTLPGRRAERELAEAGEGDHPRPRGRRDRRLPCPRRGAGLRGRERGRAGRMGALEVRRDHGRNGRASSRPRRRGRFRALQGSLLQRARGRQRLGALADGRHHKPSSSPISCLVPAPAGRHRPPSPGTRCSSTGSTPASGASSTRATEGAARIRAPRRASLLH